MNKIEQIINNTRMVDRGIPSTESEIYQKFYLPSDELQGLVDLIHHIGGLKGKTCLEVGCYRGISSETFLVHEPQEMHFVDIWGENPDYSESNWALHHHFANWEEVKADFLKRIKPYRERTNIFVNHGFSAEASKGIPDNYFDFIYIDGDHSDEGIRKDISSWLPKLKKGGYFAGHDYSRSASVQAVYHEVFDKDQITAFDDSSFAIKIN
ncbi:MAG: class I SAM-dependent methyltransferase [Crocinitomicaceae bacterium]|nr:class I SAM-dependent methyltransferase [Crocinitomicaceae bacterium]